MPKKDDLKNFGMFWKEIQVRKK